MNELEKNDIPSGAPQEVVLEYVAEPKPRVAYYIQPQPLPGKRAEAAAPRSERPRKKHKGLKIFLISLAVVLVLAGGVYGAWWFGLLPDVVYDDFYGNFYPYDDFYDYYYPYEDEDYSAAPELPAAPTSEETRLVYSAEHGEELTIQEIYRKVNPSTVTVVAGVGHGSSVGTGVLLTSDGYIITNAHVISGATSCFVVLADGQTFDAGLVGYDTEQDLAVIKAEDAQELPAAEFGDSDALTVGDTVYAIGNPLGVELRGTLTDGIVSAINRDVEVDGVTMTLIQTNAALNNGNSGGPLTNSYGQVVGINVMKMGMSRYSSASVEGLGFAIPISSSAYIINDILRCGEVQGEPVLGISVDVRPASLPDGRTALRVYTIDLGGPGDKAGLEVDDLIYEANGERVESTNDLLRVRHRLSAGEEMTLRICRGGEYLECTVILEAKK